MASLSELAIGTLRLFNFISVFKKKIDFDASQEQNEAHNQHNSSACYADRAPDHSQFIKISYRINNDPRKSGKSEYDICEHIQNRIQDVIKPPSLVTEFE